MMSDPYWCSEDQLVKPSPIKRILITAAILVGVALAVGTLLRFFAPV